MTQEGCAGCTNYLSNLQIIQKHREWNEVNLKRKIRINRKGEAELLAADTEDANPFPLDVPWKNCSMGPDCWLNCKEKSNRHFEPFDGLLACIRRP